MDIDSILKRMESDKQPVDVRAYTALHWQSGARISDLLKVDYSCISNSLYISISQSKQSNALTVQPVHFREFWKQVRDLKLTPMLHYNRFYFYRLYQRYGITDKKRNAINNSVTHAFRKNIAKDLYNLDENKERVTSALGHRSKRSADYYIPNKINIIDD